MDTGLPCVTWKIRGAGNVLGVEQHGHVAAVGFEMYCQMLKEAVDGFAGR